VIRKVMTQILCFYAVILQTPCNLTFLKRNEGPISFKGLYVSREIAHLILIVPEELKCSETTSGSLCLQAAE